MKKLIFSALLLTVFAASSAYGQNSASATANAKARIISPITLAVAGVT
ncbi:MAG: hypothetical protein M3R62_02515 [Acidobacteriota bacterium]|nr:hypothetical protein [Acidobacteriota bacterium]